MNREIEFRGKSYTEDKWLYGYLFKYTDNGNNDHYNILNNEETLTVTIKDYGIPAIVPAFNPIKKETIGQYTGLKDKNGKKIFEGDVYHHGDPDITYTVVWFDTSFRGKQNNSSSYAGLEAWKDRIEVIGNIYEDNLESEAN